MKAAEEFNEPEIVPMTAIGDVQVLVGQPVCTEHLPEEVREYPSNTKFAAQLVVACPERVG